MKVVDRKNLNEKILELLINEITLLHAIRSANVVSLISATKTENNYYLVMEYCNGGDLKRFIDARGGFLPEPEAKIILR